MKWAVVERKVDGLCKLQVIKISTSSRQIEVRVKRTAGGPPTKPPVWAMVALTIEGQHFDDISIMQVKQRIQ